MTDSATIQMDALTSPYNIKLYPIENKFIACLDTTNIVENLEAHKNLHLETIIILDRSGSMGDSVYKIINQVFPKFFKKLFYDPETIITLIAFDNNVDVHKIRVSDFKNIEIYDGGGTYMSRAVTELHKIFEKLQPSITAMRILTISDGEVFDQEQTRELSNKLAEFTAKCKISINSQAVRFFTSSEQPDTTALCSLLQLSNVENSQMIDLDAGEDHKKLAKEMADLYLNDGLHDIKILKSTDKIFCKFPWRNETFNELLILPKRRNVFWMDSIPTEIPKIDGKLVSVTIKKEISPEKFQLLVSSKLDFVVDRMKVLKIVDTDSARFDIQQMIEYFSRIENFLVNLIASDENFDRKSIFSRPRLLKLNRIKSKQITTFLQSIANDNEVHKLNAAQKAAYLRNVDASKKTGRALAKRAAKNKVKSGKEYLSFDEIVHKEVIAIKEHFNEIQDIDYKNHHNSFYSQATTIEGIKTLIEFTEDPTFKDFTAEEILQIVNIVGIACYSPIGDFPDPSTWYINEIYYGCYVSVADIITSFHQSGDSSFLLKAPGIDKEITNVIPIFDDPRIGIFLKKYAPSLMEFSSSIGMRRVIADVPMTCGFNIIQGIWHVIYDLNKNKSSLHIQTFKELIWTGDSFVGKYFNYIEDLLKENNTNGLNGYYLGSNGILPLLIPLLRIYSQKNYEVIKKVPDILRSIYNSEIWNGIIKNYRHKQNCNDIVKEILYKLLGIDFRITRVQVRPCFEPEPENIKFPDGYSINQKYLDEFMKLPYYFNCISLLPKLFKAVTYGAIEDIKDIPEMTEITILGAFDIDYSYRDFVFFNIFQALRYPKLSTREETLEHTMKIIDLKNYAAAVEDVQNYVREQHKEVYEMDVKAKRKREEQLISEDIVEKLITSTSYETMVNVFRNGIIRNNTTHKIENSSSPAFMLLYLKLIDLRTEIPLRSKIISVLLLGVDADNQIVYNNGEICDIKNMKTYEKIFLLTGTAEEWKEIETKIYEKYKNIHKYREKENRHGHGNHKPSYRAMGYKTLIELMRVMTDEEINAYVELHNNCCDSHNVRWKLYKERKKNHSVN